MEQRYPSGRQILAKIRDFAPQMRTLDAIDRQLLDLLQTDARRTADDLAREVPLSASAIARRLRRLRESGAIAAEVAILDLSAGPFLAAIVELKMERHYYADAEALKQHLAQHASVQVLLELSGAFDLLLLVVTQDMDAFNAFADVELERNPAVQRYETRFIKRRRKFTTALPLGPAR